MSNVIKFPAALKMLAATSGCPSRLILGDEKISSRIIVDLKREMITITLTKVNTAPASRWHWWWCLPAWELWRRASRAPLRRPQPTNHLGPEQVILVLVMMMVVAMMMVILMKMPLEQLADNETWWCYVCDRLYFNIIGQNMRPACIPNWDPSSPLNLTSGDFPSFWKIFMVFSWSGIALAFWAVGTSPFTACLCTV